MTGQKCPKCQKKMTPLSKDISLTNVHINHLCLTPKCYMAFTSDSTIVALSESMWHNVHFILIVIYGKQHEK